VINHATDIGTVQKDFSATKRVMTIVTAVFIGIIAVLFGILYYLKNRSRKKEIGILKAIGFTRGDIAALSSVEMLKLALPAFIIAIGLAWAFVPLGRRLYPGYINSDFFALTAISILVGFAVCVVVIVLSGIFPIYNASRIDPIEAIRKAHK